ncbi:hypothetical protein CKF46_37380, partial [Klebsiella pneumoniae]
IRYRRSVRAQRNTAPASAAPALRTVANSGRVVSSRGKVDTLPAERPRAAQYCACQRCASPADGGEQRQGG